VWAQECVARSRVFHGEAADSWDFGSMEESDRFADFMVRRASNVLCTCVAARGRHVAAYVLQLIAARVCVPHPLQDTSYYELAMQLALRNALELMWRRVRYSPDYLWTPDNGSPMLDCLRGWGADLGSLPGRAELAFRHCSYYELCNDRDVMCELIGGGRPSKFNRYRRDADDPMEFEAASSEDDDEDSAASDSDEKDAACGTLAQLRALAAPFPFHASTKAMLGPRLLDTLRGLRGADVELPPDIRDMIVDLPPW
jgi:hypothetical protein